MKPVEFHGDSLKRLREFAPGVRRKLGYQLDLVQRGMDPDDWKPMPSVGRGACEIRARDAAGSFRAIYVAKFEDAVHVLHCFQKKTRRTSQADLQLAASRYRELINRSRQ